MKNQNKQKQKKGRETRIERERSIEERFD
jgi:hypothetical protein